MKKKTFLTIIAMAMVIALTGCSKGYKVSGTVEGAKDGDQVLILALNGGQLDTLHTLTVQDGKFLAEGVADSTLFAIVDYQGADGASKSGSFFLENANIKVSFAADDEMPTIGGSLLNDRNTELSRAASEINTKMSEIFRNAGEDEEIRPQMDELNSQFEKLFQTFIRENIDNFAGQFYLAQLAPTYDSEFVASQVAAIPEGKDTYIIRDLRKQLEKQSSTAVGQPFVDFSATTPDGKTLSLSEVAKDARVLMIDFWASWCGPCRGEMPNVKEAYERFHEQGFEILGVSLDDNDSAWKKAIEDLGMTWPQISDLGGWDSKPAGLYAVQAIPATVFIKDGKIVARDVRGEELAPKIEELLK